MHVLDNSSVRYKSSDAVDRIMLNIVLEITTKIITDLKRRRIKLRCDQHSNTSPGYVALLTSFMHLSLQCKL